MAVTIRPIHPDDREALLDILQRTPNFRPDEVLVAIELIDDSIARPEVSGYHTLVCDCDGRVSGYVCYGPTPMTDHTFDLYWIVVDASIHGRGLGRALWEACREQVLARGGRLIRVETSSTELYGATKAFYAAIGLELLAKVPDFYRDGDDLLMYFWRSDTGKASVPATVGAG